MSKIIEMPKSNQQEWDALFNSFISWADALAEHQKQMDKPLRIVSDMIADEEESDVRAELEVYRNRGGQE